MKAFNKWLVAATLSAATFTNTSNAQTPLEDFLARAENQQFNTQVLTQLAGDASPVQALQGKPAFNIQLDATALFNLPDFKLDLAGLESLYAIKDKVEENSFGLSTWVGDVVFLDPTGFATGVEGRAYFVESPRGIAATIHTKDEVIQIFTDDAGNQMMISSDPADFETEGEILPGNDGEVAAAVGGPAIAGRIDGESPATNASPYTVDVLWVVTQKALTEGSLDVFEQIELGMVQTNDSYANSGINGRLRTVHIYVDDTYAEGNVMIDTLRAVQNPTDGIMDNVHALREQYGADLVAIATGANNYCGQAYLDAEPEWAFGAVYKGCLGGLTTAHEFGHNFGAHHDKVQGNAYNSDYEFGYGTFDDTSAPYWRTIMSYSCQSGTACPRIPYFSSPNLSYEGTVIGSEDEFNNVRVHNVRMAEVAGYYASAGAACTDHSATNSTHVDEGRAYSETQLWTTTYYAVGSDQQLSGYSFSNSNLAEQPTGYFTPGTCADLPQTPSETAFAPELQNFQVTSITGGFRIDGEVFDANADAIQSIQASLDDGTNWTTATIQNGTFFVNLLTSQSGQVDVTFRTEDVTGETFEYTTYFEVDGGEAPTLELNDVQVFDSEVYFYGVWTDADDDVIEIRYQFNGAGDPNSGNWLLAPEADRYFNNSVESGLAPGTHTIHVVAVDGTAKFSNVETATFEITTPEAPECVHFTAIPATSGTGGEIDLSAIVIDANASDISVQYRVNAGSWNEISYLNKVDYRQVVNYRLPTIYSNGSNLNIEMRLVDSTSLTGTCPTQSYQVNYPSSDEAPTCEIVDIYRDGPVVHYLQSSSDANGDLSAMEARWTGEQNWIRSWPGIISGNAFPVPGVGEFTLEARTLDATGLEGYCSATITIEDTFSAPFIQYASAYWETDIGGVRAYADARDNDGDIVSVEIREVGTSTWVALTDNGTFQDWDTNLGALANGTYYYEARTTDAGGRVSDTLQFEFNVDQPSVPVIENINVSRFVRDFNISGDVYDEDGNADRIYYSFDGGANNSVAVSGTSWALPAFTNLADGTYTVDIYATDATGYTSETETVTIVVDSGSAPVVENVTLTVNNANNSADVTVTASDADNDLTVVQFVIDGSNTVRLPLTGTSLSTTLTSLSADMHTLDVTVEDSYGNVSAVYTTTFEIVETTACYTDTNANHEVAGRATSVEECSFSFGGTCYGTITTTWNAVGSNDNLGTSASQTTYLLESSPGYFESVAACQDDEAPVITLIGDNPMTVYQGQAYQEPGATAVDNIDGTFNVSNISGNVDTSIVGTYEVTYNATDSSGNEAATVVRTVNVIADDVKPVISIASGTSFTVNLNESFTNPAPSATDNVDGDISSSVVITGSVDTATVGTYYLYYNVSDSSNNAADEVAVTVEVVDQPTTQCFTSTLSEHTTAGRVYEQYYSYYATGTATYLGSTFNDANTVVSLEETSPGNWSTASSCN